MVIPRYLCTLHRVMVIFANLPIFRINVSKNAGNNGRVNMLCIQVIDMPEYSVLFVVNDLVHDAPVILISLISHFF